MSLLTDARLAAFLPTLEDVPGWTAALDQAMDRYEINSPERTAAFLAQIACESSECRRLTEKLSYSAKRLMVVWPKRFTTLEKAREYEYQEEKLANYVYAKRLGNGDEASGDGFRYRGSGYKQLTGRSNYIEIGNLVGLDIEALENGRGEALVGHGIVSSKGAGP